MKQLLQDALAARGRAWGESNDRELGRMRHELAHIRKHPKRHALLMSRAFRGRFPIGGALGGAYHRGGGSGVDHLDL